MRSADFRLHLHLVGDFDDLAEIRVGRRYRRYGNHNLKRSLRLFGHTTAAAFLHDIQFEFGFGGRHLAFVQHDFAQAEAHILDVDVAHVGDHRSDGDILAGHVAGLRNVRRNGQLAGRAGTAPETVGRLHLGGYLEGTGVGVCGN